jgi:hypothetical protein
MTSPEARSPDFADIPDPAAAVAQRPAPAVPVLTEPSPTRTDRRVRGMLTLTASAGWIAALLLRVGLRPDLLSGEALVQVGVWALVGATGLYVALRPGERGIPRALNVVQTIFAVVLVAFATLAVALANPNGAGAMHTSGCLTSGILMSVVPLIGAALYLRRSFTTAPAWRGATVGAICGLAGAVGIHAHCPLSTMGHVLIGHGLPIALGALLGALWGAWRGRV